MSYFPKQESKTKSAPKVMAHGKRKVIGEEKMPSFSPSKFLAGAPVTEMLINKRIVYKFLSSGHKEGTSHLKGVWLASRKKDRGDQRVHLPLLKSLQLKVSRGRYFGVVCPEPTPALGMAGKPKMAQKTLLPQSTAHFLGVRKGGALCKTSALPPALSPCPPTRQLGFLMPCHSPGRWLCLSAAP